MKHEFTDEQLTAYVLGEADEEMRGRIHEAARTDKELAASLNELRTLTRTASAAFQAPDDCTLTQAQRRQLLQAAETAAKSGRIVTGRKTSTTPWAWIRMAAVFALVIGGGATYVVFLTKPFGEPMVRARSESDRASRLQRPTTPVTNEAVENVNPALLMEQLRSSDHSFRDGQAERVRPAPMEPPERPGAAGLVLDAAAPGGALQGQRNANAFGGAQMEALNTRESAAHRMAGVPQQSTSLTTPGTEAYQAFSENLFLAVADAPLSTFSIDVDTASYANVRRFLTQGTLPPADAVRIEEMINYFSYDYAPPRTDAPFSAAVEVAECPWAPEHRLARIGLKGRAIDRRERPATNLVFLIDVSGSMQPENKLPLLKRAMRLLAQQLTGADRVAIVTYAGTPGVALESTPGDRKDVILGVIDRLSAGGSTNGGAGIQQAYEIAAANYVVRGVNRVILATDGDFNVGIVQQGDLFRLIETQAKSGVFLSVLGFGMGNLKDATLEGLADKGNGNYAYIDTLQEARKVLVEELTGTLVTIAKDVKIQVEFNPAHVGAYRLIGYENRVLADRDFNDDAKDAGEIGAGHAVTALYELVPSGGSPRPGVDPLRYQSAPAQPVETATIHADELMTVKLRYKDPEGEISKLIEFHVPSKETPFAAASQDFKFAAGVAAFGMLLRKSPSAGSITYGDVLRMTEDGMGHDSSGYRSEFIDLVRRARQIAGETLAPEGGNFPLQLLRILPADPPLAQLQSGPVRKFYRPGDSFEWGFKTYQILDIDVDARTVTVYVEEDGASVTMRLSGR